MWRRDEREKWGTRLGFCRGEAALMKGEDWGDVAS